MEQNSIIRMSDFPTVWANSGPESLFDTVIKFCINHPHVLFDQDISSEEYKLRDNTVLHQAICHRMLELSTLEERDNGVQKVIHFFSDARLTHLTRANLSYSTVTDAELEVLSRHPINELKLYECPNLTSEAITYINRMSSLTSLDIGKTKMLQPPSGELPNDTDVDMSDPEDVANPSLLPPHHPNAEELARGETLQTLAIRTPKLTRLGLENCIRYTQFHVLDTLLSNLPYLTHLDLSWSIDVGDLSCLANKPQLTSLVLFNVKDLPRCFPSIQTLKSLRHLDISCTIEWHGFCEKPNQVLKDLVENLENLESLDISGTNLAGDGIQERTFPQDDTMHDPSFSGLSEVHTDIPGLISRVGRPLEYLGLYNTAFDACFRHHIPAKRIGGEANESQLLVAAQMNITRVEIVESILNDLINAFEFSTCINIHLALDVILHAMSLHLSDENIQVYGSAALFFIVQSEEMKLFPYKIKKKIIKTLLDAMFEHVDNVELLHNGCLCLENFKIPEDVFFEYERLVSFFLTFVSVHDQEEFLQCLIIHLLNGLTCHADNARKQFAIDSRAITVMLGLIRDRLDSQMYDEVMEVAWIIMWNITDLSMINCERFLRHNGMQLFVSCFEAFPNEDILLRNMVGLLGNIAEIKELRPWLMKDEYITVFNELLNSKCAGIEVCYHSAAVLSYIASDGPELWTKHITVVDRQEVLDRIVTAIQSWDLDIKRNVDHRSFKPFLHLLLAEHTPEAQLWAMWALANLTKVYPKTYCPLLKDEGGLDVIKKVVSSHSSLSDQYLFYASTILLQCCKN